MSITEEFVGTIFEAPTMQITIRSFMGNLTVNMDDRVLQLSEGEAKELTKQLVAHFARQAKAETYAISPPCDV